MSKLHYTTLKVAQDQFRGAQEQMLYKISAIELNDLPKMLKEIQTEIIAKTRSRKRDVVFLVGIRK